MSGEVMVRTKKMLKHMQLPCYSKTSRYPFYFVCFNIFTSVCYSGCFRSSSSTPRCSIFVLQEEGVLIPKNAIRLQQSHTQGGTANRCNDLFNAMDAQVSTPTSEKKSAGSKIAASLDKPGMLSVLSNFVLCFIPVQVLVSCLDILLWISTISTQENRV